MNEEYYSQLVALEIPGQGQVPISKTLVEALHLRPGLKAPFTGYEVVERQSDRELVYCSHCNTDLLLSPSDSACPLCRGNLRTSFSCARCHTTDDISHKICGDCGLTICIVCLAGTNGPPAELPSKCPQCGSERFKTIQ